MTKQELGDHFVRYRQTLIKMSTRIVGDMTWAEDIVQSTFEYLIVNRHRYEPNRSSPLTWLATAVQRRSLNALRDLNVESAIYLESVEDAASPLDIIEKEAKERERAGHIERLNNWLANDTSIPVDIRRAIKAVYYDGRDLTELAPTLGLTRWTLRRRIEEALYIFKRRLENEIST